jgi:endonuclease/exonuclease/phosphatase family protein
MNDIKIAFWNLGNLFDIGSSETALVHEFTPDRGWTKEVLDKKVGNLAQVIRLINDGHGPDLLGICEVENQQITQKLLEKVGRDDYRIAQYNDGPDIRGIDTSLIYSTKVFRFVNANSHNVYLRYPTRDIFHVRLEVIENAAELDVIVNHWPARVRGGQCETEPLRITAAECCGRVVDNILKYPVVEIKSMQDNLQSDECIAKLNERWNKNVLVMGDFNDQPFDKSIMNHLHATPDMEAMKEWRYIFEFLNNDFYARERQNDKQNYLQQAAYLYNCMWSLIPDGTNYNDRSMNSMNMLDQFIISRGLYYGKQKLVMDLKQVKIFKENIDSHYGYPITIMEPDGRPMSFEWTRKDKGSKPMEIRKGREPNTGYSDHFPIQGVIKII